MNIPIEDIIKFHKKRTDCHVKTLNYFAQLLGYHFPEHDSDKYTEPYMTGYAYCNYTKYHKNCIMSPQQQEIFKSAHAEHHRMQPHHIEHYHSAQDIAEIFLIEMVCDWHSANFEQNYITCENEFDSARDFFQKQLSDLNWTNQQLKLIFNSFDKISKSVNYGDINKIWKELKK